MKKKRDYEKDWKEHWEPICVKDGRVNLDQVKRELSDFLHMIEEVPKVYSHITGGLLSYPNYYASSVIEVYEKRLDELVDEAIPTHERQAFMDD